MRYMLALPNTADMLKVLQAKSYLRTAADEKHLLLEVPDRAGGHRLKRLRSWMAQAEDTVRRVCRLDKF